ncbi:hypothetical protein [Rubidibacter lacunae]|uniref:hypothetical protein n=1 Tax=Rubidibacter lacunae TaxID=582514 RepID=UPI0003FF934E|nr:hypothetical protein [Rubidibacter lacunae]
MRGKDAIAHHHSFRALGDRGAVHSKVGPRGARQDFSEERPRSPDEQSKPQAIALLKGGSLPLSRSDLRALGSENE